MSGKSFVQITNDVSRALEALRAEVPDTMQGFGAMARGALKQGALSALHKELIALAIGVASRCDACIGFHVKALIRLGVTREQLTETLAVCTYMGGADADVRGGSRPRLRRTASAHEQGGGLKL